MIVTVTANPAIDRLLTLDEPLVRGVVGRTAAPVDQPGGKGVNVARVVAAAGHDVVAVFPAPAHDSFVAAVEATGLAHVAVPTRSRVRVNLTLAEADGTTTKLNAPGAELSADELGRLTGAIAESAAGAAWVVLSGSLPPGVPDDWYAVLTRTLRAGGAQVAVDASGAPLLATLGAAGAAPDLVKPNAHEVVELVGGDADAIEADPELAAATAQRVRRDFGPAAVLLTLGASGAVLATADGSWFAASPSIVPVSTVGAGDSSLAGYLLAAVDGLDAPRRLEVAVAHGSAAASLAGSTPPAPADVAALAAVDARQLSSPSLDLPATPSRHPQKDAHVITHHG
ncbi:1-phosphofructokinase family hexose kinase [Aeromicrobium endophyticum]|uniref:1-phosphofructokinase n=1 Tax=Aeromicrobium endophyticum TaxID=2292704 RepID=A0A371P9B6_9ACTN|nr:hexose kinase [Aeromicrobium endophyticum]REK72553.1 1-phosphofructokinase [Aeromicrobium endophyticum]